MMYTLAGSFVLIALISFAVAWWATRPRTASRGVVRRLAVIHRARTEAEVEMIALAPRVRSVADSFGELAVRFGVSQHLQKLLLYAGRSETIGFISLVSLVIAGTAGVGALLFGAAVPVDVGVGVLGGLLPYLWLRRTASSRLKKFEEALPDAIDLMARALRAGHSSGSSVEIIAEQSPEPLAEEFGRCFQQQKFGIPFRDALLELGSRVPSKDLHFLITAILVQKETGGDLTQILDRATAVIRERIRIQGEIRSYTAQGRLTGWILAALPLVMLGVINVMTPGYTTVLFHDPLGQKMLYAGVGLIAVGSFIIRRIVNIEV